MKLIPLASALLLTVALTGCYEKHLIFQAEVVSMTKSEAPAKTQLKPGAEINESWCIGDELALPNKDPDDKRIGMADQVIYKAQGGGKKADFLTNVQVYRDSKGCALLTGKPAVL